jgi:hypothetical protein
LHYRTNLRVVKRYLFIANVPPRKVPTARERAEPLPRGSSKSPPPRGRGQRPGHLPSPSTPVRARAGKRRCPSEGLGERRRRIERCVVIEQLFPHAGPNTDTDGLRPVSRRRGFRRDRAGPRTVQAEGARLRRLHLARLIVRNRLRRPPAPLPPSGALGAARNPR